MIKIPHPRRLAQSGLMRRGGRGLVGLTPGAAIDDTVINVASNGTFTRSTEASYLTSASTIAWAGVDVRRLEDRGDGDGSQLLLESGATNICLRSEELDNASWVPNSTAGLNDPSVVADDDTAPDGDADADRVDFGLSATSRLDQTISMNNNDTYTLSCWAKVDSGTDSIRLGLNEDVTGDTLSSNFTVTDTWQRFDFTFVTDGTSTTRIVQLRNGSDGLVRNVHIWGVQLENDGFPSAYIRTAGSSVSRGDEKLEFASSPIWLREGRAIFDMWPVSANSDDWIKGTTGVLFQFNGDGGEELRWREVDRLQVVDGGASAGQSNVLTFSRHQKLTITLDAAAGTIEVAGATSGDGEVSISVWTWDSGSLTVGSRTGGGLKYCGRISNIIQG